MQLVNLNNQILIGMEDNYPNFSSWISKLKNDSQTPISTVFDGDNLIGICIGKKTECEKKIRLLRVHPRYQNKGIGIKLIDSMIEQLETEKPHCTVPEEQIHKFSRIFVSRYGFSLDDVVKGVYRKRKLEYFFNLESKVC